MATFLKALKYDLITDKSGCTFECQSILLGALVKHMAAQKILKAGEGNDFFQGMSVKQAVEAFHTFHPLNIKWQLSGLSRHYCQCGFSLNEDKSAIARRVLKGVKGLELSDFNDKATKPNIPA